MRQPRPVSEAVPYRVHRAEVVRSTGVLYDVLSRPHAPAEARAAAGVLRGALCRARETVARRLAEAEVPSRRTPATAESRAWSAELVRLARIRDWLDVSCADDLGVNVPGAVQVGNRAASDPWIPGLVAEPLADVRRSIGEPRLGVALREAIDDATAMAAALPAQRHGEQDRGVLESRQLVAHRWDHQQVA